jgi:predicted dehydrogenase
MIGGGQGAFIGSIHRIAAAMDGMYELVGGCFSSHPQRSITSGLELGLKEGRIYSTFNELFEKENALPLHERMQVISIVTPNNLHAEPAKLALQFGYHVILDKPMAFSLAEARELKTVFEKSKRLFCLTHTQTGPCIG